MKETLILLAVIAVWFVLQAYILPRMGISKWLNQSCQLADKKGSGDKFNTDEQQW